MRQRAKVLVQPAIAALLIVLARAQPAYGQEPAPPPEPPPRLEASVQLTFLDTRGNTSAQSLGA